MTQAVESTNCKQQEAGLKPEHNRGLCGGGRAFKPDWALPASETTEATHGNAITPPVTQLLMEPGGESLKRAGSGDQSVSWEAFKDSALI